MSLTQNIADMVKAANHLTDEVSGKIEEIDDKNNHFVASFLSNLRTNTNLVYYVDQINGDDTNDGSRNAPKCNISSLISEAPSGCNITISCLSDINSLDGDELGEGDSESLFISGFKYVILDLNKNSWNIRTANRTGFNESTNYIQLNQHINLRAFNKLYIRNGKINVSYTNSEHENLYFHNHPSCHGISEVQDGFLRYYNIDVTSEVPDMSIVSLDAYSGTHGNVSLNNCNFKGKGTIKYAGNGDVDNDDLHVVTWGVTLDETFDN